jgi:hypothetical protein
MKKPKTLLLLTLKGQIIIIQKIGEKTSNNGNIKNPITGVYQLMLSADALTSISLVAVALEVYLNNKFILSNTTSLTPIVLVGRLTTNNFLFNKNDDVSIKVKTSQNGEYYL